MGAPPIIPVCFESSVPTTGARRAQIRNHTEAWQRVARVNFTQWDNCTSGEPGLHVELHSGGGSFAPGGKPGLNGVNNGIKLDTLDDNASGTRFRNVVMHELGHALGLFHEEERSDYVVSGDRNFSGVMDSSEGACFKQTSLVPNNSPRFFGSYDIDSVMSTCGGMCFTPGCEETNSELSPNDIASIQTLYGRRISGQLVSPQGDCAASPANDGNRDVFLWDCDEVDDDQEFVFTPAAGTLHIRSGIAARPIWCMESTTSGNAGNVLLFDRCDGFSGQEWRFDSVELRGFGGLCLDLENGNTNGGLAQLFKCGAAGGVNQQWTITRQREIKFGGTSSTKCLDVNANGRFVVTACNGSTAQKFDFANGRITRASNGQCLDAQGPLTSTYAPTNGTPGVGLPDNRMPVQQFSCIAGQLNQQWNTSGRVFHVATQTCLERTGSGALLEGSDVRRNSCNGSAAQRWDYHF